MFLTPVFDWIGDAADTYWNNSVFNNGVYDIDPAGVLVLGVHLVATLLYFLVTWVVKTWRRWRGMDPLAAGMFRHAAARGEIEKLATIKKGCWRFNIDAAVEGWTALHAAAAEGQPDSLSWLLAHGASLEAQKDDKWQDTVLHYAAASGSRECVQILLAHGAQPLLKNFAGLRPHDYAAANGHRAVVQMLDAAARSASGAAVAEPQGGDVFYNSAVQGAQRVSEPGSPTGLDDRAKRERLRRRLAKVCRRGYEGAGSQGTIRSSGTRRFRVLGVVSTLLGFLYLVWRACRSLTGGWLYFYSIPLFFCEYLGWIGWANSVIGLWCTIDRPARKLQDMIKEERFPTVDVYIVTYSEPVEVIEPTVIAALNMNYPAEKLTVYILDDGRRAAVRNMALKLDFQCQYFQRSQAKICYIGREKVKGVPHHAKAGNINHALLKAGVVRSDYVLVLDCDMLVHPDFLLRTLGHFYRKDAAGKWVSKEKIGFLQTPQDFWNIELKDPLFHLNSFFFGPMLKGRDGLNATPCAGTGVVFRRDVLVSLGGQSYGSVTEDFNTSMHLLQSGFANMYLDEHLTFGMAPEDVPATFQQRLRWAMGAIQIYFRNNPLRIPGLSHTQSILFWDVCFSHFTAICIIYISCLPIVYMFLNVSPIRIIAGQMWEFVTAFLAYYLSNRLTMLWAFLGAKNGMHNLWRSTQQAVWIAPNHLKAVWKVARTEIWFLRWTSRFEIGFAVTSKEKQNDSWRMFKDTLACVWPYLVYYAATIAAIVFVIVFTALGKKDVSEALASLGASGWAILTMMAVWPPLYTLLPRVYTDEGWKVVWHRPGVPAAQPPASPAKQAPAPADNVSAFAAAAGGLSGDSNDTGASYDVRVEPLEIDSTPFLPGRAPEGPLGSMRLPSLRRRSSSPYTGNTPMASPRVGALGTSPSLRRRSPRNDTGVTAIAMPSLAPIEEQVYSNFGRVGVGADHLRSLQRQQTVGSMLPPTAAAAMQADLAALYHDAARAVNDVDAVTEDDEDGSGIEDGAATEYDGDAAPRFPRIIHTDAEPDADGEAEASAFSATSKYPVINYAGQQDEGGAAAAAGDRLLSLGGLQLRIHAAPSYDVATYHDARGHAAAGAAPALGRQASSARPEVLTACASLSRARHVPDASAEQAFVTYGRDKRLGVPLMAEALDYALLHGAHEEERQHLFASYLLSRQGGAGAEAAALVPAAPAPAATNAAEAAALADVRILEQPDFGNRKVPPESYTFVVIFGLLVVGLAVAAILDAVGVLS